MIIKKELIAVQVDDVTFYFKKPNKRDMFAIVELTSDEKKKENPLSWINFCLDRLEKIEGVQLEDGTPVGTEMFLDLPNEVIDDALSGYMDKITEALGLKKEADEKNEQAA